MKKLYLIIAVLVLVVLGTAVGAYLRLRPAASAAISYSTFSSSQYPSFKGICQFTGEQHVENATDPDITCASLNLYWNQFPKTSTGYDFSQLEKDISPWAAQHKGVIIRITSSGNCYQQFPGSCQRTPDWVFHEGVRKVIDPAGGIHPVYWDQSYLNEWKGFIQALAAKYDGDPRIIAFNLGTGSDGELRVASSSGYPTITTDWQHVGYTDQVWWDSLHTVVADYADNFHKTPLAMQAGEPFLGRTYTEAQFLESIHSQYRAIWLQDDGLVPNRKSLPSTFSSVPHIEEPLSALGKDSTNLQGYLQEGLNLGGNYIYVFAVDVTPQNKPALDWARGLLH